MNYGTVDDAVSVRQNPGMAPRKKKGVRRVDDVSDRLPAPTGYASWLDYAVAHIDARNLQNENNRDPQPGWPGTVTTEQIRASAKEELEELRPSARGKLTTTHELADFSERALARQALGRPEKQKARAWVAKRGQKAP